MRPLAIHSNNQISWQAQFKNALRSTRELESFFQISISETNYPILIPRSFATKIIQAGKESALWKQFIPNIKENDEHGLVDPIGDCVKSKGAGIIHRYKNRVLFTPTTVCPIICRYCFRKNELYENMDLFKQNLSALIKYIDNDKSIEEVILTGGDPLILSNEKLDQILNALAKTHIKYVRFHTRTPIILPTRIDEGFFHLLEQYSHIFKKIIFVIHTNHSVELDTEVKEKLKLLAKTKVECLTQSVLLKGVNDNTTDLIELFKSIVECDFRPYYLHHPDKVKGGMHFYLSKEEGHDIYTKIRDHLSGWAIPHYVVDSPDGSGKKITAQQLH